MTRLKIGDTPRRSEDTRFLTGKGRYVDDLPFDNLAHAFILRSPHAHARILGIDTAAAARCPGVLAILTGADQAAAGITPMEPYIRANFRNDEPFAYTPHPPLALDRARYVGQPVAVAIARNAAQARDAAERIDVDYEALPAVVTAKAALADGAVLVNDDVPGNVCLRWRVGDDAASDRAFAAAAHVARLELYNHRVIANSMEPRGGVGLFDPDSGDYTLYVSSQSIHMARDAIAATLGVASERVRLIARDVGGGFGTKNFAYGEQVLMAWAARVTGRPVKWINDRAAGFVSDHQARDHAAEAALALDADGKFLALRVTSWANLGAYLCGSAGRVCTDQYAALPDGLYAIPSVHLTIGAVATHTVPVGVTRGPGFAEATNILERLIDRAARDMGIDRADLRRRNMIAPDAMPFTNATGTTVDSGHYAANLDAAMALAEGFDARRRESEARGLLRGLGFACHVKGTGGAPEEKIELTFGADDTVTLTTGTQSIGQGHETTFPQIISDLLGVPFARIRYRHGDTGIISKGGGHGSSRATYMGGTAIYLAVEEIIEKGRPIAAQALEAAAADIEFADGRFRIAGTDRSIDILAVARIARDSGLRSKDGDIGLDTPREFIREAMTYPNGCHVAEVEIDPQTGKTAVARYGAVDDYGEIVNPMVAAGQVHGAIAQGIGQALLEHGVYDERSGQLLSGSFMDYAMPRADDLPFFDVAFNGVRCTTNPLGVKGCGESGAIAGFPAIANAIGDALAPFDINGFDGPATAERVWRLMKAKEC
jgi:carbon-monoxide dehydrogenase large subunit